MRVTRWTNGSRSGREGRLAGGSDVDDLPSRELQGIGLVARQLRGELLAVVPDELDPDVEAEVDEPDDHRLLRRPVRLEGDLEVVRSDEGVPEPVDRPDELHHELVLRLLVELDRSRHLLDL